MQVATIETTQTTDRSDFRAAIIAGLLALILVVAAQGTTPATGTEDWHGNVARQMH